MFKTNACSNNLRFALLLTLVVLLQACVVQASPPQYFAWTGHWYKVYWTGGVVSWNMARDSAATNSGYLACIADAAENSFLCALPESGVGTFVGGFNITAPSPNGTWLTGEPWSYTNWNYGEPSSNPAGETAVELYTSHAPADRQCEWNNIFPTQTSTEFASFIVEYNYNPDSSEWCDDLDDGSGWLNRWQPFHDFSPVVVSSPTHDGSAQALSFQNCWPGIYRKNFVAGTGEYSGWVYQSNDQSQGAAMIIQSDFDGTNWLGTKYYSVDFSAAGTPGGGIMNLQKRENNVLVSLGTIPVLFPRNEWARIFVRKSSSGLVVAGYVRTNGDRDSILYFDSNPLPDAGKFIIWSCGSSSTKAYIWDDVCYQTLTPHISLDSSSLSFAAFMNCALPSSKSFTITNIGGGTLDWTVSDDSAWLNEAPTSGSSNSEVITVSVNTTNKAPGTYKDTIRVSSTNADNSPLKVVVTYVVNPGPHLVAVPATLNFTAPQHCALPASQSFTISNSNPSSCTLDWTVSCISPWLNVAPTTGTGNNRTITVSVNTTELSLGLHCDTLCITSTNADNSPQQVIVCYTVTPGPHMVVAPSVLNFSATRNGPLPAPQTFNISNSTGCTLSWEVLESISWLAASPTGPGSSNNETITVSINTTDLPAAPYSGMITVNGYNADNSPVLVGVNYSISTQSDTLLLGRSTHVILGCGEQYYPLYLNNHQKIKGGYVPLKFPTWDFLLDSISFDGTRLAFMQQADYWIDSVSTTALILFQAQTGPVYNVLPAVDAATIDQPIAKIYISEACNAPLFSGADYLGGLDTATIYRQYDTLHVIFTDSTSASVTPAVSHDSVMIAPALCGDANGDGAVDISDAVTLICYIFTPNCLLPCVCGADVNCDGARDISDAVYLIGYIFSGGPAPCDCKLGLLSKTSPTSATIGINELGGNEIGINAVTVVATSALQLAFSVPSDIEITSVTSRIDGMEVFSGMVDGEFRVGLIDMSGKTSVPAGEHEVVTISYTASDGPSTGSPSTSSPSTGSGRTEVLGSGRTDGGQIELKDAIVVGEDATKMNVTITNPPLGQRGGSPGALPKAFSLSQNVPNPFNPATTIAYAMPQATQVRLDVMNVLGQTVRTLLDEFKVAGNYSVIWDGRDNNNQSVASGIYLYRLTAGNFAETRKMILLK